MKELIEELISLFCLEDSIARERAEKMLKGYLEKELNSFADYLHEEVFLDSRVSKGSVVKYTSAFLNKKMEGRAFDDSLKKLMQNNEVETVYVSYVNYDRLKGVEKVFPMNGLNNNEVKIKYK